MRGQQPAAARLTRQQVQRGPGQTPAARERAGLRAGDAGARAGRARRPAEPAHLPGGAEPSRRGRAARACVPRYGRARPASVSGRTPHPPGRRLPFVSSCEAQAGCVWKGRLRAKGGRGGGAFLFTSFPNSPPLLRPRRLAGRGGRGAPDSGLPPGRCSLRRRAGAGRAPGRVSSGADAARRALIAPRASGVRRAPGSEPRFPRVLCVPAPGEGGGGAAGKRGVGAIPAAQPVRGGNGPGWRGRPRDATVREWRL